MAEQKTEDTNAPLARRGARPFAGPAGAPSTARPFVRPASPGQRPAPASFAPRPVASRPALGNQTAAAASSVPDRIEAARANVEPATTVAEPVPEPVSGPVPEPVSGPVPEPVATASRTIVAPSDPTEPNDSVAAQPPARPVASEMVALDASDAFDALWASVGDVTEQSVEQPISDRRADPSPPLDGSSLGTLDAPSIWSDDITDGSEQADSPAPGIAAPEPMELPAWLADDHDAEAVAPAIEAEPSGSAAPDGAHAAAGSPSDATPPWLEAPSPDTVERPPMATPSIAIVANSSVGAESPPLEPVDEAPLAAVPIPAATLAERRGSQVSAALGRLAERVRAGEIDVSSTAPDATDAAMLAAVLAALLGGSSR